METKELLKKIRILEIKAKGLTKHIFSGEYHAAFKGRGMTFSEVRNYNYGDEVRTIDWNVTARYNEPYIKVFDEERELTVMLIIDISKSEEFGTTHKTKRDLALESAAILSFSAISNNDKIGLILFSDRVERYIPPAKGRKHALYILREIIAGKSQHNDTQVSEALRFFRNTQKKRSIAFLISDFMDDSNFMDGIKISNKNHDLVVLRLQDPAEQELMNLGIVEFFNAETGDTTWVDTSNTFVRENYKREQRKRQEQLDRDLRHTGVDFVNVSTEEDLVKPLIKLFKER